MYSGFLCNVRNYGIKDDCFSSTIFSTDYSIRLKGVSFIYTVRRAEYFDSSNRMKVCYY